MAQLPQTVKGSDHSVQRDGVIWRCQNDTFVKVSPARSAPQMEMGGGGPDGISSVAWLRRLKYEQPAAWLATGKALDSVVFDKDYAFCIPAGGYETRKDDGVYRFPISAINTSFGM